MTVPVARIIGRFIAVMIIAVCALPGLVYFAVHLVELRTARPFSTYAANDAWTYIQVVDVLVILYGSAVLVPLMWILVVAVRRLPRRWMGFLISVAGVSTVGVAWFWLWAAVH